MTVVKLGVKQLIASMNQNEAARLYMPFPAVLSSCRYISPYDTSPFPLAGC